ncbi:22878_t:CDS:1 [Gigaspora margarita]|uniref:22878_t:CDS:1 n=1 Tax=Gigaspora margarita TaxID=4874 RepID=A0ABN7UQH8_GIGMA|nr:22878_t:CDS:1 [Gigaspora margarita]
MECSEGLPANNWNFAHLGDDVATIYVFYANVSDNVEVAKNVTLGSVIGFDGGSSGSGSFEVKSGDSEAKTNVKVLEYIRFKGRSGAYLCLRCLYDCCKTGHPDWNKVERELNRVMRSNGIYLRATPLFNGPPMAYLTSK